jgi:hypothetical protein
MLCVSYGPHEMSGQQHVEKSQKKQIINRLQQFGTDAF